MTKPDKIPQQIISLFGKKKKENESAVCNCVEPVTLYGEQDPTASTKANVGDYYVNTVSTVVFACVAVEGDSYRWSEVGNEDIIPITREEIASIIEDVEN
ncbi:MAG: hypothetical protein J6V54_10715 [Bacteroidales bacterium]|nr:hypothetical protein [Bacteroidales bacterium]